MKTTIAASLAALATFFYSTPVRADIQPAELVAGSISLQGNFVVAEIYVGGTYGQTYPKGRTATLEVRTGSGAWSTLWSGVLPNIGTGGYYITRPYGNPVKVTTTFRLRISGSDRNPGNDVRTETFRAPVSALDPRTRVQIVRPKTDLSRYKLDLRYPR